MSSAYAILGMKLNKQLLFIHVYLDFFSFQIHTEIKI